MSSTAMKTLAIKLAGPFRATAREDGTILLTPAWHTGTWRASEAGVFAQLELAEEIEDRLNALHRKLGRKAREQVRRQRVQS